MSLDDILLFYITCHPGLNPGSVKKEPMIKCGIRTKLLPLQILKQVQDDDKPDQYL